MDRMEFLESKATSLSKACKELQGIEPKDRPVVAWDQIVLRECANPFLSSNGGDYKIWCNLYQEDPGVYRIGMHWSADWDIRDYAYGSLHGLYVALSKSDLEQWEGLPLMD